VIRPLSETHDLESIKQFLSKMSDFNAFNRLENLHNLLNQKEKTDPVDIKSLIYPLYKVFVSPLLKTRGVISQKFPQSILE
jgi:hypothetical protein